jgi:hypothetical protein
VIDEVINKAQNGWLMKEPWGSRRTLYSKGDVIRFERDGRDVLITGTESFEGAERPIWGRPIRASENGGRLHARDYGRTMVWWVDQVEDSATGELKPRLRYEAEYEWGPVQNPDEGGDGDPR